MFSLCVPCYFSSLVISFAGLFSVCFHRQRVGVNMLEKSLKSVKHKTKSISISLSGSLHLPLLPHICLLLLSSPLTPPQLRGVTLLRTRLQLDMKARQGLKRFWSLGYVTPRITSTSRLRQLLALLCVGGVDRIRPRLCISVNIKTTLSVRCHMFWPALKLQQYRCHYSDSLWVKKHTMPQNRWWADDSKPLLIFKKFKKFWVIGNNYMNIFWKIHIQEQTNRDYYYYYYYLSEFILIEL